MAKGIRNMDAFAQKMMKQHKKEEIFKVGDKHLYFSKKAALVTAGGDEEKVEKLTLDKSDSTEESAENGAKGSTKKGDK